MTAPLALFLYVVVGMLWGCLGITLYDGDTLIVAFAGLFWPLDVVRWLGRGAAAWWRA